VWQSVHLHGCAANPLVMNHTYSDHADHGTKRRIRGCILCLSQVCYSWWCMSCLSILDRLHWIDQKALTNFILYCQVCRQDLHVQSVAGSKSCHLAGLLLCQACFCTQTVSLTRDQRKMYWCRIALGYGLTSTQMHWAGAAHT
jgi:hypothetical protein